jgi:hypothetical protein
MGCHEYLLGQLLQCDKYVHLIDGGMRAAHGSVYLVSRHRSKNFCSMSASDIGTR